MGTVLVFLCLLSYASCMNLQKKDVRRSTLEENDPEATESIDKIVLQHANDLLAMVLEEPEAEGSPEGKIFCLENVRIKYATCRLKCESKPAMERLQCNAIMFHRYLINCYGDDLDCYDPGVTTTSSPVTSRPVTTTPGPTTLAPQTGSCGMSLDGIVPRIVGGTDVTPNNKYPWQVGLSNIASTNLDYVCSGSIITKKHILTAASCFNDNEVYNIGFGSAIESSPDFQRRQNRVFVHPRFNRVTYDYNIAIIELDQTIDFDKRSVRPICLPGSSNNNLRVTAIVSGWGEDVATAPGTCQTTGELCRVCSATTDDCPCDVGFSCQAFTSGTKPPGDPCSTATESCQACTPAADCPCGVNFQCQAPAQVGTLQETQVLLDKCPDRSRYTNNMICSDVGTTARDACSGDAGGPLILDINGRYEQIGIVSFGDGCGTEDGTGVYVNVGKFLDWINEVVAPERTFR